MDSNVDIRKAVACSVACSLSFAGMTALIKATEGIPLVQVIFFRSSVSVVFIYFLAKILGRTVGFKTDVPRLHILRILFGVCSMVCFFAAYRNLEIATVSALSFSRPLFIFILARLLLKEAFRKNRAVGVVVGFIGVVLVLDLGSQTFEPFALIVLAAAFFGAFALLLVRKLTETDGVLNVAYLFMFAVSVMSLLILPWYWLPPTTEEMFILLGVGILGGFGQVFLVMSYKFAEASFVAPLAYLHLVWVSLLGFVFWQEIPSSGLVVGSVIIFCSQIYLIRRET